MMRPVQNNFWRNWKLDYRNILYKLTEWFIWINYRVICGKFCEDAKQPECLSDWEMMANNETLITVIRHHWLLLFWSSILLWFFGIHFNAIHWKSYYISSSITLVPFVWYKFYVKQRICWWNKSSCCPHIRVHAYPYRQK